MRLAAGGVSYVLSRGGGEEMVVPGMRHRAEDGIVELNRSGDEEGGVGCLG